LFYLFSHHFIALSAIGSEISLLAPKVAVAQPDLALSAEA
jgi:hypothetical protein